jgi:hypothetical protein
MPATQIVPLLIGMLVGALLSVMVWSVRQARSRTDMDAALDSQHQVLFWLLLLAMFTAGVFVTFALLRI